jgi:16S rRNA (uracil1498-N3)-methyltransferase
MRRRVVGKNDQSASDLLNSCERRPLPRFYLPELDPAAGHAMLPEDEAIHLTRVMRLGAGAEIAVFDGRGREFRAQVEAAARARVRVALLEAIAPAPEMRVPLTLVQAVLKGDKMDAVVRDATMMGVAAVEPIITSRTIGRVSRDPSRLARVAVASAKQCRRAVVPAIAEPCAFSDWLIRSAHGLRLLLVEPSATDTGTDGGGVVKQPSSLRVLENHASGSLALIVGPEGGWTDEEVGQAEQAGCIPVSLGPLTLRADAVAIAAIAVARFALGE